MGDILIWQGGGNYYGSGGVRKATNGAGHGAGWRADCPGWPLNHLGITHPGHPSGRLRRVRGYVGTLAGCLLGARGNKADRAMCQHTQATAEPPAGVPRRSSLALWSLEGEPEFRCT